MTFSPLSPRVSATTTRKTAPSRSATTAACAICAVRPTGWTTGWFVATYRAAIRAGSGLPRASAALDGELFVHVVGLGCGALGLDQRVVDGHRVPSRVSLADHQLEEAGGRRALALPGALAGGEEDFVDPRAEVFGDLQHDLRLARLDLADEPGIDEDVHVVLRGGAVLLLADQPVPLGHGGRQGGRDQRGGSGRRGRRLLHLVARALEKHVAAVIDPDRLALLELLPAQAVDVDAVQVHRGQQKHPHGPEASPVIPRPVKNVSARRRRYGRGSTRSS